MAFIDQGEFEAMKSLSGLEAARASILCLNQGEYCRLTSVLNKKERKKEENGTFATAHFCI